MLILGSLNMYDLKQRLNEKEVSKLTSIPLNTLRKWRCQHKGPAFRKIGNRVVYVYEDVLAWLEFIEDRPMVRQRRKTRRERTDDQSMPCVA